MWRRDVGIMITLALGLLAVALVADAQPLGKTAPRIGVLDLGSRSPDTQRHEALLQGLREHGWGEGQNIAI